MRDIGVVRAVYQIADSWPDRFSFFDDAIFCLASGSLTRSAFAPSRTSRTDRAARVKSPPLFDAVPPAWRRALGEFLDEPWTESLAAFVARERERSRVFPPPNEVFRALELTPPDQVKAVILGQDPYHGEGQAHGLAFSVRPGTPLPPTLKNIFKELQEDLRVPPPSSGSLIPWAEQGVLLLNAVLTVREATAGSHQRKGWEQFTDEVIRSVAASPRPRAFVFWGKPAQKKLPLVTGSHHLSLCCAHPSPLSAYQGFFGSRPFSRINAFLEGAGVEPIDWRLP